MSKLTEWWHVKTNDAPNVTPPPINPPKTFTLLTPDGIKDVQRALIACGYLDPIADGKWGGASNWALKMACARDRLPLDYYETDPGMPLTVGVQLVLQRLQPLPLLKSDDPFLDRVVRAHRATGAFIARHPACRNISTPEGHNLDGTRNDDARNVFNDVKMVWHCDEAGRPVLDGKFVGTSTPSEYWTTHPMRPEGAFNIAPGWQKVWVRGEYHGRALLQAGVIRGFRDLERKGIRDLRHPWEGDDSGVHHHQGYNLPRNDEGHSSAGCNVIRLAAEQEHFIDLVEMDARFRANHGYLFAATVLEQKDVPL